MRRVAEESGLQGPFDAAFFNSVFGNILDQRQALLFTALQLKPGEDSWLLHTILV